MGKVRRFSQASPIVASYIRDLISKDVQHKDDMPYIETLSEYSLVIPMDNLQAIENDPFIMDKRVKTSLEELKVINWCPGTERLIPLSVSKDGNSLCHSVSIALWGIHDQSLQLRQQVKLAITNREEFKNRWFSDAEKATPDKTTHKGLEKVLEAAWEALININVSEVNRPIRMANPTYDPLEEIHIFVLANILRRPVIVLSDRPIASSEVEDSTSSGGYSSIYLPLLWSADECKKTPILLGYSENYFAPLVTFGTCKTSDTCPEVIPLTREDNSMICVRFVTDDESNYQEQLLKDYLQVVEIEAVGKSGKFTYISSAAKLTLNPLTETQKMLREFIAAQSTSITKEDQVDLVKSEKVPPVKVAQRRNSLFRCGNKTCTLFITNDSTFPYCSDCYRKKDQVKPAKHPNVSGQESATSPERLEVDCETPSCPYLASVNSFPFCQRCHLRRTSEEQRKQRPSTASSHVRTERKELSLEEKWLKLAMGIIDEEVVSGLKTETTDEKLIIGIQSFPDQEELMFANKHRTVPLDEDEEIAIGGVTSTRSLPAEDTPRRRSSVSGGRSIPVRRLSIEEENTTRSGDEWQRRVSWVNEPCQKLGCPYFASLRTFPYCNQCASEVHNMGFLPSRRKVSGTARILPPFSHE